MTLQLSNSCINYRYIHLLLSLLAQSKLLLLQNLERVLVNVVKHKAEASPGSTRDGVANRVVPGGLQPDLVGKELGGKSWWLVS